jgi:hypothetical protein
MQTCDLSVAKELLDDQEWWLQAQFMPSKNAKGRTTRPLFSE